jgi:hypothetical protein
MEHIYSQKGNFPLLHQSPGFYGAVHLNKLTPDFEGKYFLAVVGEDLK